MEIVAANPEDLDQVVDLWHREGGPTSLPGGVPEASALLRRDPGALLIAHVDERVVGSVIVGWDGWRCHLYHLVVEPGWRRSGVAASLVTEAKSRAQALGARKIDASVNFDNGAAIAFWEGRQFDRDPRDGRWSFRC